MPKAGGFVIAQSQLTPEHALFRRLLREARLRAGLNQAQLGERAGMSQLLISRGEMGDRKTDVVELYTLCEAMGISFADFTRDLADALAELKKTQRTSPTDADLSSTHANPSQPERTRRKSPRQPPTAQRKES